MNTTARWDSQLVGQRWRRRGCDEPFIRDGSRVRFRTTRGRPFPDLWMLSPQRGSSGRRYNRRVVAMLAAYNPILPPEEPPVCPYRKRQYLRAWTIGLLSGERVRGRA